ncbi:MAG: leucyl-tRNA synthetase, partial [Candidatus Omnitrophota bacterium]
EMVIQVNGKVRSKITVARDIPEEKLKELAEKDEKLAPWLQGRSPRKVIVVPHKLVNIVL